MDTVPLHTDLISDDYRAQNAQCHEDDPRWGPGNLNWVKFIVPYLQNFNAKTIIDYGCGKGGIVNELNRLGFNCYGYDPAVPEFNVMPSPCDFLLSVDVLEHIEPEKLGNVLAHMASLSPFAYIAIATRKAKQILPDGRNAHLIVENDEFWIRKLSEYYKNIEPAPSWRPCQCVVFCQT